MELPIAPQTYQPSADTLVRAMQRVELLLARTACEETQLDVATALTHPQRPGVPFANFALDVRLPAGRTPAQVLDAIDALFTEAGVICHRLVPSERQWPSALAAEAESRGYRRVDHTLLLLHGYRPPAQTNTALQVLPGRAVYPQLRAAYEELARDAWHLDERRASDTAAMLIDHLDDPRIDMFLGRLDRRIAGWVNVITLGQIGVIDKVQTLPHAAGQDVAATLLGHAIEHCRRALFEQVIVQIQSDDEQALRLYEGLGFKPVTTITWYERPTAS